VHALRPGPGSIDRRRAGFTLVEALLAAVLVASILGSLALATSTTADASKAGANEVRVEAQALRALSRAVASLELAGVDTLDVASDPDLAHSGLQFQSLASLKGGTLTWADPARLEWRLRDGESDDGTDEDGNGLVDDGRLVLVLDPGGPDESTVVLANGVPELLEGEEENGVDDNGNGLVDEGGFCITRDGDALTLRLTVSWRDAEGQVYSHTARTTVQVRN